MVNVSDRTLAGYIGGLGTKIDVQNSIADSTSLAGMTPQAIAQLEGAIAAAAAAGLSQVVITAAKGEGHKSHQGGTEWDIKGVNPNGSRWTNAQRVAVAKGAQSAGADRFGLYQMDQGLGKGTLHFGYSGVNPNGKKRPAAVWGAGGATEGAGARRFTDPSERAFLQGFMGASAAPKTIMSKSEARDALAQLGFTGASAVKQFQRAAGITADGIVGKDTTRELRAAVGQGSTFANGQGTPSPGTPLPRSRPASAPTLSASDMTRDYQRSQPMAAPTIPVARSDIGPARANYDPLSSMQAPRLSAPPQQAYNPLSSVSAPRIAAQSAPAGAPQIATTRLGGIGSDQDRNFPNSNDAAQVASALEASNLASRVNADYRSLRNGYGADNGTGARLPAAPSVSTMGANSVFDDGTVQSVTPAPTFSSRTSEYDPLSSVQSTTAKSPPPQIGTNSFDDRWNAVLGTDAAQASPSASMQYDSQSDWNAPYNGPDAGYGYDAKPAMPVPRTAPQKATPQTARTPIAAPAEAPRIFTQAGMTAYDPLSSIQAPATVPTEQTYDPLSSVQPPTATMEEQAAAVQGPQPLGNLKPLSPTVPRFAAAPAADDPSRRDPWAATPKVFRPGFGLGLAGSMVGGLTLGPGGALLGRILGQQIGKRLAPAPVNAPRLNGANAYGLGAIEAVRAGAAPKGTVAQAVNNPAGYQTVWSSGPNGSPMQTTHTPSGGSYSTYSIGPSLSPIQVTVFNGSDSPSGRSGGSGNPTGTGGLY